MCPSYLRFSFELLPGRLPAAHRLQKGQFRPDKTFHSGQHPTGEVTTDLETNICPGKLFSFSLL